MSIAWHPVRAQGLAFGPSVPLMRLSSGRLRVAAAGLGLLMFPQCCSYAQVKPHIIATVTEEQRLTIFDVEKKDMLRTCLIGFGANAVHFSPVPLTSGNRGPGHQRFGMAEKLLNGGRANGASSSGTAHHIAIGGLQGRLKVVVRRVDDTCVSHLPCCFPNQLHLSALRTGTLCRRLLPPQEEETLAPVFVAKDFATDIEDVRYSPNGELD